MFANFTIEFITKKEKFTEKIVDFINELFKNRESYPENINAFEHNQLNFYNESLGNIYFETFSEGDYQFFNINISEDKIIKLENNKIFFQKNNLSMLVDICIYLWEKFYIEIVYSHFELEDTNVEISNDLSFNPFAIIRNEEYENMDNKRAYTVLKEIEQAKVLFLKNIQYC